MTTFTTEDRQAIDDGRARCGCGKSLHQPYCDGSHARTDKEMLEWADKVELEKYRKEAMGLWFDGGSCTGGQPE
jgi:CDGSH-type Zn-finger protein